MEVGHENEPVMLGQLSFFWTDVAVGNLAMYDFMELNFLLQAQGTWIVTSSGAIEIMVDDVDYTTA